MPYDYPVHINIKLPADIDAALTKVEGIEDFTRSDAVRLILRLGMTAYVANRRRSREAWTLQVANEARVAAGLEPFRTELGPDPDLVARAEQLAEERAVETGPTSP